MQILKNVFQMRLSMVFDVKKSNPDFEVLDFPGNRPKFFAGKKKSRLEASQMTSTVMPAQRVKGLTGTVD